jgi:hypothetical protein
MLCPVHANVDSFNARKSQATRILSRLSNGITKGNEKPHAFLKKGIVRTVVTIGEYALDFSSARFCGGS